MYFLNAFSFQEFFERKVLVNNLQCTLISNQKWQKGRKKLYSFYNFAEFFLQW